MNTPDKFESVNKFKLFQQGIFICLHHNFNRDVLSVQYHDLAASLYLSLQFNVILEPSAYFGQTRNMPLSIPLPCRRVACKLYDLNFQPLETKFDTNILSVSLLPVGKSALVFFIFLHPHKTSLAITSSFTFCLFNTCPPNW